jgi:hypothetical protein
MWPRLSVFRDPCIQVGLQLVDRTVHLFAERDTCCKKPGVDRSLWTGPSGSRDKDWTERMPGIISGNLSEPPRRDTGQVDDHRAYSCLDSGRWPLCRGDSGMRLFRGMSITGRPSDAA